MAGPKPMIDATPSRPVAVMAKAMGTPANSRASRTAMPTGQNSMGSTFARTLEQRLK